MPGPGKPFKPGQVSDPQSQHPTHLYQPDNAIQKGVAAGEEGYRVGIFGSSVSNAGVYGKSESGAAIYGVSGGYAGYFEGHVHVTGMISAESDIMLSNADCAEDFDVAQDQNIEPGTVMVLGPEGKIQASVCAYDRRVAGVISGAGGYKPGIVLDKQNGRQGRHPIALFGKVCCKVDAQYGSIGTR